MVAELLVQGRQDVKQPPLAASRATRASTLAAHLVGILAGEFDEHQRLGLADDEVEIVAILEAFGRQPQDQAVEQLGRRRLALEDRADRGHGMGHRVEVQHHDAPHLGQGQQVNQRFGDDAQTALGADEQLGQVELGAGKHPRFALFRFGGQRRRGDAARAFGHELVEVVSADAAQDRRKAGHDLVAVGGHDSRDLAMDVADQVVARLRGRQVVGRKRAENVAVEASESTTSSAITLSTVLPCQIERAPAELLPIMPPTFARLLVATSGPNCRPCGAAAALSWSSTTPGSTRAVIDCGSMSIARMYLLKSRIKPAPIDWPERLVPPPRGTSAQVVVLGELDGGTRRRRGSAATRRRRA